MAAQCLRSFLFKPCFAPVHPSAGELLGNQAAAGVHGGPVHNSPHHSIGASIVLAGVLVCRLWVPPDVQSAERWPDERSVGPFVCHADFPLAAHANLLGEMARLQEDLARTLSVQAPREQINLYLFEKKGTYQRYIKSYFPNVPFRRALYIKQRGPGMVFAFQSNDFETDVRHEGTHALLHAAMPMVPLWLDEGLAEYFEVPGERRAFGHPHLSKIRWATRFGQVPKIERLDRIQSLARMGPSEYRNSWAWVHFMLHGSEQAHKELTRYLKDIQAHVPPGSLAERLRRRLPSLEGQFAEHFRSWKKP